MWGKKFKGREKEREEKRKEDENMRNWEKQRENETNRQMLR